MNCWQLMQLVMFCLQGASYSVRFDFAGPTSLAEWHVESSKQFYPSVLWTCEGASLAALVLPQTRIILYASSKYSGVKESMPCNVAPEQSVQRHNNSKPGARATSTLPITVHHDAS